ncbi:Zn(2)-C6 fungal-type domain-containing protein [Fusarium falciforme]|uniref:Zn(2)-C6 fungal-type domain-containing protein n=1 Tax=Fusarium falciforme TaxID=195108 RepID=UPI00230108D3|nr:Zn(2)-C6 fungal-type domain-containing protein [Fusarium falciforme]WAO88914.1 Zn(2)-C6 fungal-type domain-containing protein [Fusarium falciforme]
MASPSPAEVEPSAWRGPAFRVRSEFGGSRTWRSRKSRPCDACRGRKTACIIETAPPCLFCKSRNLPCESSSRLPPRRRRRRESHDQGKLISLTATEIVEMSSHSGHSSEDGEPLAALGDLVDEAPNTVETVQPQRRSSASSPPVPVYTSPPMAIPSISPGSISIHHESEHLELLPQSCSPSASIAVRSVSSTGTPRLSWLEGEQRTAHSIGLSGEQDTNLLASLRSIIVNEHNGVDNGVIQVFPGDPGCGEPPIHFNMVLDALPEPDRAARRDVSDSIEELVGEHGPRLVSLFFKYVHPMTYVVSKSRFLRAYYGDAISVPASLRGVIYALGANSWKRDPPCAGLTPPSSYTLFQRAHWALHTETHAPNKWTLQAALLLIHEQPGDNFTMETPRTWIVASKATAIAQMLGLHRDPRLWKIAPLEKSVRRKLWWATYMADVWASLYHGNPPHIAKDSFTTSPIQIEEVLMDEDVNDDSLSFLEPSFVSSDVTASARFVESVKLSRILRELLDSFYSDQAYKTTITDTKTRESKLFDIEKQLESWMLLRASCVGIMQSDDPQDYTTNAPLHLSYYAVKTLYLRALMWPSHMAAKTDPKSALRRYYDKALREFSPFVDFLDRIDSRSLNSFWGDHARSQLVLCGNFLVFLFLMAPTSDKVQETFRLLEGVHSALKRCRDMAENEEAVALLRPVLLRVETLFTQAARIMDTRDEVPI